MGRFLTKLTLILIVFQLSSQSLMASEPEVVFKFYCAQCHGLEGKGDGPNVTSDFATDPRDFTNKAEMEKLSDADIRNVVLDGGPSVSKSSLMPPWSKTLSTEQVDGLVTVLRKFCDCKGP